MHSSYSQGRIKREGMQLPINLRANATDRIYYVLYKNLLIEDITVLFHRPSTVISSINLQLLASCCMPSPLIQCSEGAQLAQSHPHHITTTHKPQWWRVKGSLPQGQAAVEALLSPLPPLLWSPQPTFALV